MGKENIYCEIAQSEDGNTWNVLHGKNVVCRCIDKKSARRCAAELEMLAGLYCGSCADRYAIRDMVDDLSAHMRGATRPRSTNKDRAYKTYLNRAKTDVRFAAAGPELLEACKALRAIIHDDLTHERQREHGDAIAAADAAIAKAEGGAA
jgi:hypothetical protein